MIPKLISYVFILAVISSAIISGQNQHIISVYPNANLIGAERGTEISIQLDTELDSTSFPTRIFNIFGSNSGVVKGTSHYDRGNKKFTFTPNKKFFAGEVITVGFGPANTTNGDILLAYHWQFTVQITKPTPPNFKTLVQYPIGAIFPFYCIDMDNDGSLDIISTNGNIIYNNGDGTFTRSSVNQELYDLSFISDLNNDGYPDLIRAERNHINSLYISLNDGNGNFTTTQSLHGIDIYAVGDVNGDNYDDLLTLTNIINDTIRVFQFYLNDKSGHFNLDSNKIIVNGNIIKAALVDVNRDGNLDAVFLDSPWFGRSSVEIYLNQGGDYLPLCKDFLQVMVDLFIFTQVIITMMEI